MTVDEQGVDVEWFVRPIDGWMIVNQWWDDPYRRTYRVFCGCGWKSPNMASRKRAVDELHYHQEKEHGNN